MRLTVEEHPEAIKRYRHVERARGWKPTPCSRKCPGTPRICTRAGGHRGPHVAHGRLRRVLAVWDSGGGPRPSDEAVGPPRKGKTRGPRRSARPVGLRTRSPLGIVAALERAVARATSSLEQIALIILFLAFVWFGIDWLLLILR